MRELPSIFGHTEEERGLVRVEDYGLKRTNDFLKAKVTYGLKKQPKKCIHALAESVPEEYIGSVLNFKKGMSGWAPKEVSELNMKRQAPSIVRTGCADVLSDIGIFTDSAFESFKNIRWSSKVRGILPGFKNSRVVLYGVCLAEYRN